MNKEKARSQILRSPEISNQNVSAAADRTTPTQAVKTNPLTNMETETTPTISQLRYNKPLWWRLHVFIYDLRNFGAIPSSQARLDKIVDASYLGAPYFSDSGVLQLKATVVPSGKTLEQDIADTLEERLDRRMKKRVESDEKRRLMLSRGTWPRMWSFCGDLRRKACRVVVTGQDFLCSRSLDRRLSRVKRESVDAMFQSVEA